MWVVCARREPDTEGGDKGCGRERGKGVGKKENGRRRGSTTVLIGGASMAAAAAEGRSINVASAAHAQVKHARERAAPARP